MIPFWLQHRLIFTLSIFSFDYWFCCSQVYLFKKIDWRFTNFGTKEVDWLKACRVQQQQKYLLRRSESFRDRLSERLIENYINVVRFARNQWFNPNTCNKNIADGKNIRSVDFVSSVDQNWMQRGQRMEQWPSSKNFPHNNFNLSTCQQLK